MLWFKKKPKVDEEAESFRKRYETVENFVQRRRLTAKHIRGNIFLSTFYGLRVFGL